MDYKLSGNPKEVEKVIRENRIRIQRGVISITPLDCDVEHEDADVKDAPGTDTKDEPEADTKTPKSKRTKKTE